MGRTWVLCLVAAAACSKSGSGTSSGGSATTTPPANDPCGAAALGLGSATKLEPYQLPAGCELVDVGEAIILRSAADAEAHVRCGDAPFAHDFSKQALVVKQDTLSPASTGIVAFDDGTRLTWVTMQRSPCPDDPRPMPVPIRLVFAIEQDAAREFDAKTCTYHPACN